MMNNQEFQPPNGQPINNDPRERSGYSQQQYNDDPREQPWQDMAPGQMYGEKLQPQQRKRRGPRGCIIALVATVLVLGLLAGGFLSYAFVSSGTPSFGPGVTENHTFHVGTSPHLVINDPTGTIRVHSGGDSSSTVSIQTNKRTEGFGGNPNNIQVNYTPSSDGNTITVTVDDGPKFIGLPTVNFDVTVPGAIDLNLQSNTGSINVDEVTGQMSLQSNTGSITAEQDHLTGSSTLKTDTGSVTFDGTVAPNSSYEFSTNTGSVNVTLPTDATFHVDAKTDTGSFNSDFPGVNANKQDLGAEVHSDVGTSPNTTLTLNTNTGSIHLNQSK